MTLNLVLMIGWIMVFSRQFEWSSLTIGVVLFTIMLVGLVMYLVLMIKEVRLAQRQWNFIDSVTHELKSPIASLKLYLETMKLRSVDDKHRDDFINLMMQDLKRLDLLINRMLEIARLDAIVAESEDVDLESVLRETAANVLAEHRQPADRISLKIEPAIVRGGRLAVGMIFRNLIDNAIKYGGDNPSVDVTVQLRGDNRVVTRIADHGNGVPPSLRKEIFGLFFRGGNELERTRQGTGLGLYIVHTLVRKLNGRVSVSSRPDRTPGSVFEVDLPGRAAACGS